jgi:hypothetical protein
MYLNLNMLHPSRLMTFLHGLKIYDTYQIFASRPSVSFLNRSVNCRVQIGLDLAFRANFNLITIQKISLSAPCRISLRRDREKHVETLSSRRYIATKE